ncbi:MAG: hypothetical protein QNK23_15505 [Crocinitomicaceae bacterium]|nr:hypothetical protein [Crocinitomicaceae bacterium]
MANPLHRSDTFPHENEELPFMRQYFLENNEGWFNLTVYLDTDEFVLTAPNGDKTDDNFLEMHKRKELYGQYDGIYDWMILIREKVNRIRTQAGVVQETLIIDDLMYTIRICEKTTEVWISLPRDVKYFDVKDAFLVSPELIFIQNGELEIELRRMCELHGLDLPSAPLQMGISVSQK